MSIIVKKRDGSEQAFSAMKISEAVKKVGTTDSVAESIAVLIEAWASQQSSVSSLDIRSKVIDLLKMINPVQGAVFEANKKKV